ncbi:UDP-N-acetylmuramoyl-tripeptide--D-alanyl-D-alanine ligase [Cohaesibacter sp. ES.047]|uniref:UDP-N-acetylmuramoylalanyl-D-glutamyl-2, 6-diaminopimelate--D-alanyl-D-alanine ligase n=1 Tax=Cohaesibacter sp. ES.047 TaxID=1798205 RepID=UPI000BB95721|nr:UDP-N-acetylmuramoylalanyl-D-glutamyl-2,6-diaminopimelate--D-alanyl-D-alanine ligase [Cohaesibacter sp. ES.047]SNY94376.1 UDP-N-acetylmuramoyl-tripeptide--D-alanyl-D-alanine ligase [Cohaesibacter sp. ES.047]
MTALWTAADFSQAIVPSLQPGGIGDVFGISIDSRTVATGDAFFAIAGERFDGHDFARVALDAGASVVVLEQSRQPDFSDLTERVVFVDDPLKGLELLGVAARRRVAGKVIAVTGSVGKTSTKDALRAALAPSGKVHAAVSSFNNHWGVPLTLARMPRETDFGVFEIGMNHPGEIRHLVGMVAPDLAIITTVVAAHIGNFESLDQIAAAKAEIFEGVVEGGAALINADNPYADYLSGVARENGIKTVMRFGRADDADIHLDGLTLGANGSDLSVSLMGDRLKCHLSAPGEHLAQNALAVLGAIRFVGGDIAKACAVLGSHGATKGRGAQHRLSINGGSVLLTDESYNANPSSVAAALAVLGLHEGGGRKIAVLGDMLELGDDSADQHKALLGPLEAAGIDMVYLCGPMMAHLWEILPIAMRGTYAKASADLITPLKASLRDGDTVMIKGSHGSKMGPVVMALLKN